jgi:hypothetical protein
VISDYPRGTVARVNRDDIRRRVFATEYLPDSREFEDVITRVQHLMVGALLVDGVTVICDDTNLYPEHTAALMRVAVAAGVKWQVRDFTGIPLSTCLARDHSRLLSTHSGDYVGPLIITAMHDKHSVHGWGPMPVPDLNMGATE